MSESLNISALIKLLDEPDENTYQVIRQKIWTFGIEALPPLEKAWENSFNPLIQDRIQEITRQLRRDNSYTDFVNWARLGSPDLLKGFILVTKTQYPDLIETEILAKVEQIRMDVWLELHENLTALENVKVLNHILFGVHLFDGNKINTTAPQNSYINTLLESHQGSPLSLGMLYVIIAQKLGLPVYGVNLPQHFILAYLLDIGLPNPSEEDVLFYINPFNKGAVFTRREIELFIRQMKIKPDRSFFAPCTHLDIIKRLIHNLIFSYDKLGYADKIDDLENLLSAIE
ncbi:MAG: transglutaminase-like domain-containing protein [Bacteroidales bacterium]|nr:transglutaminase-like domain-containing protein [Bacteroidales bacterium]